MYLFKTTPLKTKQKKNQKTKHSTNLIEGLCCVVNYGVQLSPSREGDLTLNASPARAPADLCCKNLTCVSDHGLPSNPHSAAQERAAPTPITWLGHRVREQGSP